MDAAGNVFVADLNNSRVQEFNSTGYLTQFGTFGTSNGQFMQPIGVAVDAQGNVYVADSNNDRVQVFNGSGYINRWGILGSGIGRFNEPCGIAVDAYGNVFVADLDNGRVQEFNNGGQYEGTFTPVSNDTYITIIAPTSYSSWVAGSSYSITWVYGGNISQIFISLYQSGKIYSMIATSYAMYESYYWTIPSYLPAGNNYQIVITDSNTGESYYGDTFVISSAFDEWWVIPVVVVIIALVGLVAYIIAHNIRPAREISVRTPGITPLPRSTKTQEIQMASDGSKYRYCQQCGAPHRLGDKFCAYCGSALL